MNYEQRNLSSVRTSKQPSAPSSIHATLCSATLDTGGNTPLAALALDPVSAAAVARLSDEKASLVTRLSAEQLICSTSTDTAGSSDPDAAEDEEDSPPLPCRRSVAKSATI